MQKKITYKRFCLRSLITLLLCVLFLMLSACSGEDISIETVKEPTESPSEEVTGEAESESTDSTDNEETASESENPETIYVYVCGAVKNEGVYELKADSRVTDALDMAGGYRDDAFRGYVNLAEKLSDGQRIYIPTEQEVEKDKIVISTGLGADGSEDPGSDGPVNINLADRDQLKTLSGIGDSKAEDIIAYRESSGGFGSIEDIKNVSGIGDATFNRIKDRITVN